MVGSLRCWDSLNAVDRVSCLQLMNGDDLTLKQWTAI